MTFNCSYKGSQGDIIVATRAVTFNFSCMDSQVCHLKMSAKVEYILTIGMCLSIAMCKCV